MIKVYREEGGKHLVAVLGELWLDGMHFTWLRCLFALRESSLVLGIEIGEEWDVCVVPGSSAYSCWHLSDPTPEELACLPA